MSRLFRILRVLVGLPDARAVQADEASEQLRKERVANASQAADVVGKSAKPDMFGAIVHDMRHHLQRLNVLRGE